MLLTRYHSPLIMAEVPTSYACWGVSTTECRSQVEVMAASKLAKKTLANSVKLRGRS